MVLNNGPHSKEKGNAFCISLFFLIHGFGERKLCSSTSKNAGVLKSPRYSITAVQPPLRTISTFTTVEASTSRTRFL